MSGLFIAAHAAVTPVISSYCDTDRMADGTHELKWRSKNFEMTWKAKQKMCNNFYAASRLFHLVSGWLTLECNTFEHVKYALLCVRISNQMAQSNLWPIQLLMHFFEIEFKSQSLGYQ